MPAFVDNRELAEGEFVVKHAGVTYVGRLTEWRYRHGWGALPTLDIGGLVTQTLGQEVAAPAASSVAELTYNHLTVTYVNYEDLPVVGEHTRLYLISRDGVLLPCAYVYRPMSWTSPDDAYNTLPYKPTNLSAEPVRAAFPHGSLLPRWHTANIFSHVCHRVPGDSSTWSMGLLLSNEPVFADPALLCDITGETLSGTPQTNDADSTQALRESRVDVRARLVAEAEPTPSDFMNSSRDEALYRRDWSRIMLPSDVLDEVSRNELLQDAGNVSSVGRSAADNALELRAAVNAEPARRDVQAPFPLVTYVSCLDELPVQGEEHRLYCIYGYEAAYIYCRGYTATYRPTNLSAARVAAEYADGATVQRLVGTASEAIAVPLQFGGGRINRWRPLCRANDEQVYYVNGALAHPSWIAGPPVTPGTFEALNGRRDNSSDHAFTRLLDTAIPTQAVQGDPVVVPIPRLTPEQLNAARAWGSALSWDSAQRDPQTFFRRTPVLSANNIELNRTVAATPPPPPAPQSLPVSAGRRRILPL